MLKCIATRNNGFAIKQLYTKRFYSTSPNQLLGFEQAAVRLKVKDLWDWYGIKYSTIKLHGLPIAEVKDQMSMIAGLQSCYPLHCWEPWRWDSLPSSLWLNPVFQEKYLRWLGDYIGVQSPNDWYLLRETDIVISNGAPLLGMYGNLFEVLKNVLPEENAWQPWCFVPPLKGLWNDKENHRKFFEWIAKEHNITKMEDWYNVRLTDVRKYGAKMLADKYKDSLIVALQTVFPEHNFLPWGFNHTRKFIWEDMKYQRQYLDWLAKQLNITKQEDWFFVNPKDIVANYGTEFLDYYECDFLKALKTVYPEQQWKLPEYSLPTNLVWSGKLPNLHVDYLRKITTDLFPSDKIYTNYSNEELIDPSANNRMQFDVYLPRYSLAFDFQNEIHYHFSGIFGPSEAHQKRHELKAGTCEKNGITLISIPYWVEERSNYSQFVAHLIKRKRPTLLSEESSRLSPADISYLDTLPNRMAIGTTYKKGKWTFGDALAMPDRWNDNDDPIDCWVSEKLDGVRAFWDGQRMYNARGYPITTPDHFRNTFPEHPVEGELYAGPNSAQFVNDTIRTGDMEKWKNVQFHVFDTPEQPQMIYEKRHRVVQYCTTPNNNLKLVEVWKCTGKQHLEELYQQVLARGGEGLVLRKPKSHYFDPHVFYKKEPFVDEEVLIWKNQTEGKLNCLSASNTPISVSAPEKEVLPVGSIVTIKSNTTDPSEVMRVRPDLDWYEVRRQSWNPYRVGYGLPLGLPKCRGCKTVLRDRNKPRIMVDCLFYPKFSSPYPGQVAFCMNIDCIRKGTFSDCTIHSKDIFRYPHWDGTVGVPGEIWDYLKDEMAQHKQIKWQLV